MHRFYVDSIENGKCRLSSEDMHHALHVLRLRTGEQAEIICQENRYLAVLLGQESLEITKQLSSTEPSLEISLFQGVPKGDKMDWIVQKAAEIGIVRIVPVMMQRCVVKLLPQDYEKKRSRWERIAREAGKQSGRCRIPTVTTPVRLSDLPSLPTLPETCIVPWEEAQGIGPRAFILSHPGMRSLGILIGPEGGIDAEEMQLLGPGFIPVTLGPRILRTETAGLAAASAILALSGEME